MSNLILKVSGADMEVVQGPMSSIAASPTLCFIHIPKVAGTAIRVAAWDRKPDEFHWYDDPKMPRHWHELSATELSRFRFVAGHIPRSVFDEKILGPKLYLCLVRNPLRRAVSLFEYIVNGWDETHPFRGELRQRGLLWAIENHEGFRTQISDDQCRMIAGAPSFDAAMESLTRGDWIIDTSSHASRAWNSAVRTIDWPRMRLGRDNASRRGYFEELATARVVEAIAAINREDEKLVRYVEGLHAGVVGLAYRVARDLRLRASVLSGDAG